MNVAEFIAKWEKVELTESSASHQHFLDLCEVVDHPKPAKADPTGASFTFERGATKHGGGDGWADVWKKGYFGWEYKGKKKDLDKAYDQLLRYREALERPPLLVVCDMERIVVHVDFTGTPTIVHDIALAELGEPRNLEIVRHVFHDPQKLKPGTTSEAITTEAAERIAEIAQALRDRGLPGPDVAHFLDRIVFCLFAEDVGLLPELLVTRMLEATRSDTAKFGKYVADLFQAMATGGDFLLYEIRRFNGNLFEPGPILELTEDEIERLYAAARLDWSAVDPSVFGTLFERGMDPAKRSQLGAHYTSREDIEILIEPVVMKPLRREWDDIRGLVENLLATGKKKPKGGEVAPTGAKLKKAQRESQTFLRRFHQRLAQVKVLDPACGSGNFLYVTLQKLKDLEKEIIVFAMEQGFPAFIPLVGPWQLHGIEKNPYAFELAQMTVWIGYLQWTRNNGFGHPDDPVLKPMDTFECKDAVLELSDSKGPKEPDWPKVDFIVGNPPFLGGNKIREELGDVAVDGLFEVYRRRVPAFSDLCCYWFEKARSELERGRCRRVGLLATQGIRGGANRRVLQRIRTTGDIFFAISDRAWILDGAAVHVSMVGFDLGQDDRRFLDGKAVETIHSNLRAGANITLAVQLPENRGLCFMGPSPKAPFDIEDEQAIALVTTRGNLNGVPNSDVLRLVNSAVDITKRSRKKWTIDFGLLQLESAARYEAPFEFVRETVYPVRSARRSQTNLAWWQYERPRVELRGAVASLPRFVVTPAVAKHRVFVWRSLETLCNQGTLVFARPDDYFFGVLHSRVHEVWARAQGTQLRERESGFRYTPSSCFETFAFPKIGHEGDDLTAAAAKELDELRELWISPPEWTVEEILEFPGSVDGPWKRFVHDPEANGIGTVRYPRLVAKDEDCAAQLKRRTLTNLYNQRPTWLDLAHKKLDEAVFAAYGWPPDITDEEILEKLLTLNLERAAEDDAPS